MRSTPNAFPSSDTKPGTRNHTKPRNDAKPRRHVGTTRDDEHPLNRHVGPGTIRKVSARARAAVLRSPDDGSPLAVYASGRSGLWHGQADASAPRAIACRGDHRARSIAEHASGTGWSRTPSQ